MLLKTSAQIVAIYQLLSAAIFAGVTILFARSFQAPVLALAFYVVLVVFNLLAGIESLRNKRSGYWASFFNMIFQIPSVSVPGFAYDYIALGQVSLAFKSNPPKVTFVVGFSGDLAPGTFMLWFGNASPNSHISVGLISMVFAAAMWKRLHSSNK
jgi:hypothetical protein